MSFEPFSSPQEDEAIDGPFRILSVEDDSTDFYILKVILEKYFRGQFEIQHQQSLDNLYDRIESYKPHILLLDYYLHGLTSFETIDYLKSNYPYMFISILSGQEDIRTVLKCVEKGVSYVMKGENLETDLLKTLNSAIQYIRLIKSYQKSVDVAFSTTKIPFVVFGMTTIGPEILFLDRESFGGYSGEDLIDSMREMGMYTLFASGQGENYNEGLSIYQSGSFPNFALYVHSFRKMDKNAQDERLRIGYFQAILFVPKENLYLFPPYNKTQEAISKIIAMNPQEVSEINWESLKMEILEQLKKIALDEATKGLNLLKP